MDSMIVTGASSKDTRIFGNIHSFDGTVCFLSLLFHPYPPILDAELNMINSRNMMYYFGRAQPIDVDQKDIVIRDCSYSIVYLLRIIAVVIFRGPPAAFHV